MIFYKGDDMICINKIIAYIFGVLYFFNSSAQEKFYFYFQDNKNKFFDNNIDINYLFTNINLLNIDKSIFLPKKNNVIDLVIPQNLESNIKNFLCFDINIFHQAKIISSYSVFLDSKNGVFVSNLGIANNRREYWYYKDSGIKSFNDNNTEYFLMLSSTEKSAVTGWMGQIYEYIKEKPLNHIIIPGSYEFATLDSIEERLEKGVRYIQLELFFDEKKIKVRNHVDSKSQTLDSILEQVKSFLLTPQNSKELVIIDIKKVQEWDKLDALKKIKLQQAIKSQLSGLLVPKINFMSHSMYKDFILKGQRVLVLQDNSNSEYVIERKNHICEENFESDEIEKIWAFFYNRLVNRSDECKHKLFQSTIYATPIKTENRSLKDIHIPIKMHFYEKLNSGNSYFWLKKNGNILVEYFTSGFDLALMAKELNSVGTKEELAFSDKI